MSPLLRPAALLAALGQPGLAILDATYFLPNEGRDGEANFRQAHLPGARFFDIDAVADHASGLPHMLPSPADFAAAMQDLGISNTTRIIVYDQRGIFSAPRLWWMLRVFGHDNVQVLDGGLPGWIAAGGITETGEPGPALAGQFTPALRPEMVRSLADMRDNLDTKAALMLDARAGARFRAEVSEPRAGMRSGHILSLIHI